MGFFWCKLLKTEPCNSIFEALDKATPNSRIIVGPGRYHGGFTIDKKGIKLESTAGPISTTIIGPAGLPVISVIADNVSIGKAKGKGFTIMGEDETLIQVGSTDIVGCFVDEEFISRELYSNTRIEGNRLFQTLSTVPPDRPSFCLANVIESRPYLSAINVTGDKVTLSDNVIEGSGTVVIDLVETTGSSTIKGNNVKHNFSDLIHEYGGAGLLPSFLSYRALYLGGIGSSVSDNQIELTGGTLGLLDFEVEARGIYSVSEKAKIIANSVIGFGDNIHIHYDEIVSKNIVNNYYSNGIFSYIASSEGATIKDNTINSGLFDNPPILRYGLRIRNPKIVQGNNINVSSAGGISTGMNIGAGEAFGSLKSISVRNNNVYGFNPLGDECNIVTNGGSVMPVKMSGNFYGDTVFAPSIGNAYEGSFDICSTTEGHNIYEIPGDETSAIIGIEGVTMKPSLKPNAIKAKIKTNRF